MTISHKGDTPMTHPLFAALDAALAEHGWPVDCEYLHVTGPSLVRPRPRCAVYLTGEGVTNAEMASTFADAYAAAVVAREARQKLRRDQEAVAAARKLLADAGIDPNLVSA